MQKAALLFPKTVSGQRASTSSQNAELQAVLPLRKDRRSRRATPSSQTTAEVFAADLPRLMEDWLIDCQIRNHSKTTINLRRTLCQRLQWFVAEKEFSVCGKSQMRHFIAYLVTGHTDKRGRWDRSDERYAKALAPATVKMYFTHLATFFTWLVYEEYIDESPMEKISTPQARPDQVQPFTEDQIEALLAAAKLTRYPHRDYALVLLLLDTGMRSTELCTLKNEDLDLIGSAAYVLGKGNKRRQVCFGRKTARALRAYLKEEVRNPKDTVFLSARGVGAGAPLTRSGVRQIIKRLILSAALPMRKCGPHKLRHTMAVSYLRNGGQEFTLQHLLGHTSLKMTSQYVALAQADIQKQHQLFSPSDRTKT